MADVSRLESFNGHPFYVSDGDEMEQLKESIKENGIMEPIIIFVNEENTYEIISGHRRVTACRELGIDLVPAIVKKDITRDEAVIMMGTVNLERRKNILPSEKAATYKMMYEAMKRQGERRDMANGSNIGVKAGDEMAGLVRDSRTSIQRYIKLCNLIDEMMLLVDKGKIKQQPAGEIADMKKESQMLLYQFYEETGATPTYGQARKLKELDRENRMDSAAVHEIMIIPREEANKRFVISDTMRKRFFPECGSQKEVDEKLIRALRLLEVQERIRKEITE